jgi:hypothetical protein
VSWLTPVEVVRWGPEIAEAVDRLEKAYFAAFFLGLMILFTLAFLAVAAAYRR